MGAEETASGVSDEIKICPDCAETTKAAARVCRHCGYRFDLGASASEARKAGAPAKSAASAALFGLLIGGVGNLYVGEMSRGLLYLGAICTSVIGAIATDTIGPGPIIAIISAIDAYRGAKNYNATGKLRGPGVEQWLVLGVVIVLVAVALGAANESSSSSGYLDP